MRAGFRAFLNRVRVSPTRDGARTPRRLSVATVSGGPTPRSLACVLLAMTLVVGQAQERNDPWEPLKDKAAWILLGLWDEELNSWGTLLSHVPVAESKPADGVPSPGETIRMTHKQSLEILGYRGYRRAQKP
jgi:hypothetical protein